MLTIIAATAAIVITGLTVFKGTYAEPTYTVVQASDNIELRAYEPMIVAEVTLPGDMNNTMNDAFRILAGYIFGNNISMTSPVLGTADNTPTTIAMTAPVIGTQTADGYTTRFVMPKDATLATLPKPADSRITLRTLQGQQMLAIKYSWFMGEDKVQEGTNALLAYAAANNLEVAGNPTAAFYDNPYTTLPWQRRNEVLLEVKAAE